MRFPGALCGLTGKSLGESFIITYAPSLTVLAQAVAAPRLGADRKTAFLVGNTQDRTTTIPGLKRPDLKPLGRAQLDQAISSLKNTGYRPVVLEGRNATRRLSSLET